MQSLAELEQLAGRFPSMGGKEIGPFLRNIVREAPANSAVVEVGSWLGAGTAQLALGVRDRGPGNAIPIYAYDRWEATDSEVEKAERYVGLSLEPGADTLPHVRNALQPFEVEISYVKGDILDAKWGTLPISVYVDDAAKAPKLFFHALRTFGPHWIPGVTILVLMDYHMWKKTGSETHKCQMNFIESHADNFTQLDLRRGSNAAFKYEKRMDFAGLEYVGPTGMVG